MKAALGHSFYYLHRGVFVYPALESPFVKGEAEHWNEMPIWPAYLFANKDNCLTCLNRFNHA